MKKPHLISSFLVVLSLTFLSASAHAVFRVNLQENDLEDKQLTQFPEFKDPRVITNLNLEGNQLTFIPSTIKNLINLIELDVSENKLTMLPKELFELVKLQRLDFDNNALTTLPEEISLLTQLKAVELRGNRLSNLPVKIGALVHLTELNLDNNLLTEIPTSIGSLASLQVLKLANNKLRYLPQQITQLKLTLLDLSGNTSLMETSPLPGLLGKKELKAAFGDAVKLP